MSQSGRGSSCFGLRFGSSYMGLELGRVGAGSAFRSSAKSRSAKAQVSDGDIEDNIPLKSPSKSSGSVLLYVGVASLGAILFGYHLGVVNGALEYLAKDLGIVENTVLQGWVVSTLLAGATVGSFTGGSLADHFGRTKTFMLDAIPLTVGAFLCATAKNVETMIIGRLLSGIGIGISSAIVPLYISEISPTEIRGTLGSINQLFICIGILAALVAGLPLAGNPLWWRTMFGIAVIPSVLLALGMAFSPESPRWLVQQRKISQAEQAIKKLYGKNRVTELITDLTVSGEGSEEQDAGWFDLFSGRYFKGITWKSEKGGAVVGYETIDHLSPGSVLEASFSNDSCCSSSLEDSSGRTQHADSTSYSYDESQFLGPEKDPFYSGVSLIKENICSKLVANTLTYISEVLSSVVLLNARIKGNTLAYAKEVIFNAELVLGNQMPRNPNKINSFFICCLLLELDTLTEVMWTRFGNFLGSENPNTRYQLKRFVFDCIIEYLDSKYSQYSKCGFRAWLNLPAFTGSEILIHEVVDEVRRWTGFVGVTADELVERDMSHSLGKWTDFEIEAYETGAKVEGDILQMLVDEIFVDITN